MTLDIAKTKLSVDLPNSIYDLNFNEKCVVVQHGNDLPSNFWLFLGFTSNIWAARIINLVTGYERLIPREEQHCWLIVRNDLTIQNNFHRSPAPEKKS